MLRTTRKLVLLLLMASLVSSRGTAQSGPQSPPDAGVPGPSEISEVKIIRRKGSPAVEIICTHQIIPSVARLDGPPRLIIDLPNTELSVHRKRMEVHSEDISAVRLAQYHMRPPVVQVVVDLVKPHTYTWEVAGNRLIVRLQEEQREGYEEGVTAKGPPIALAEAIDQARVSASLPNASHLVLLDSLASGASVSGGAETVVLRLSRGEIHVCRGSTVSVTRSQDRSEMMVALSTGALETHYALERSMDAILTPDFRILLRGPGEFHYAIKVDSRGNACIRSLPRNTGSVTVSELIGSGEREMKAGDQLVFHSGRFAEVDSASEGESCGCPADATPMLRASLPAAPPPENPPLPALSPGDLHVQVDVPMVFPDRIWPENTPMLVVELGKQVSTERSSHFPLPEIVPLPPSAARNPYKPAHSGFIGRIRSFAAGLFR